MHVLLTPEVLQRVAEDNDHHQTELLDLFSAQDPRIEHISTALLTEVLEGGISGRFYVEGLSTALAAHLIHAYTSTPRPLHETTKGLPQPLLRRITSLIEERLTEDLSLVELASEVGLSPSHFSSLFRKTTGLSPHHYIVQRRLERAQHLLTSTRLSIGEIATAVGFCDQSHLVRQMRRVRGVTPTYIRNHLS
jgi:AraC family transcriptional regulator